jgi:hypothetical protein
MACKAAGVARIPNGTRHSAITFKVALTGDVARVALESGNSPSIVHAHYRGLATVENAKRFFAIMPREDALTSRSPLEEAANAA